MEGESRGENAPRKIPIIRAGVAGEYGFSEPMYTGMRRNNKKSIVVC